MQTPHRVRGILLSVRTKIHFRFENSSTFAAVSKRVLSISGSPRSWQPSSNCCAFWDEAKLALHKIRPLNTTTLFSQSWYMLWLLGTIKPPGVATEN